LVGEKANDPKPTVQGKGVSDVDRLRLWEIWDKENNEVMVIAGTSFVVNSTNVLDTSSFNWFIIDSY